MRRAGLVGLGLIASAAFVYLAVRGLDIDAVRAAFSRAELFPWLPLGLVAYAAGHVVRGIRCRRLVARHAQLPLTTATNIVLLGYAGNNVLPARLGELVRAGMLAQRAKMPVVQALGVTFIERVLDGLAMLAILAVATLGGTTAGWIHDVAKIATVVFGIATAAIVLAALRPIWIVELAGRVGGWIGERAQLRCRALATSVTDAATCLREPKDAVFLVGSSIVVWCFETLLFLALLPVFQIEPSLQLAALAMCVTGFSAVLPSSPGAIGPFHYFASKVVAAHGVDPSVALAYATLVHLSFFVPVTLWGAGIVSWYGIELSALRKPDVAKFG